MSEPLGLDAELRRSSPRAPANDEGGSTALLGPGRVVAPTTAARLGSVVGNHALQRQIAIQREDPPGAEAGTGTGAAADPALAGGAGAAPLSTKTTGTGDFTDTIETKKETKSIPVLHNAADYVANVKATLGGDGGHEVLEDKNTGAGMQFDEVTKKLVSAKLKWKITETVPTLGVDKRDKDAPGYAAETDLINKFNARIDAHEDSHATIDADARTGLAAKLSGKTNDEANAALDKMAADATAKQTTLDGKEGNIDIGVNAIIVSGRAP